MNKIKLSKCYESRGGTRFTCVICGADYWLNAETCEGLVCCMCADWLSYPEYMKNQITEAFYNYNMSHDFYHVKQIWLKSRHIRAFRAYLLKISKEADDQ